MEALLSLDYSTRLLLSWGSALALGLSLRAFGKQPWHQALGIGIMTVPMWSTVWNYVNSIQFLADPGSTLPTYSTWILSGIWSRGILTDLGYVGAGFILWARGESWSRLWSTRVMDLAAQLRDAGLPLWRSEGRSIAVAFLAFPLFLAGTWLINALVYAQPALVTGDESSVWDDMTPYHTVWISLAAGFGEELVYRGVLLVLLLRIMPAWAAVGIQALVFGFGHAGYGTLAHVIVPTLFGIFAGVVALRFGLWSAIVFHVLIDIMALGIHAMPAFPWFGTLLTIFLVANSLATFGWAATWFMVRRENAS